MQIVIEITDRMYEDIKQDRVPIDIGRFIKKGTPLPKGHGDLIDRKELNRKKKYCIQTERGLFSKSEWFIKADDLFSTPTIIKADKQKVR